MNEGSILAGIGGAFVLFVAMIVALGIHEGNSKTEGCREAGGAMVGEICIIRNDCKSFVE
jgi:hypothetical protein